MKEQYLVSSPNLTQVQEVYNITIEANNTCIPTPSADSFQMLKVKLICFTCARLYESKYYCTSLSSHATCFDDDVSPYRELQTMRCLGLDSFLDKLLRQFGTGVLIRYYSDYF